MTDTITLLEAIDQSSIHEVSNHLRNYKSRVRAVVLPDHTERLAQLKRDAVDRDDQVSAKAVWCLETIARIQDHFESAFQCMRSGEFMEAWFQLERCESELKFLSPHFADEGDQFGVEYISIHTKRFQNLFNSEGPMWGISPEFLHKGMECSICHSKITLRSGCDHKQGEIYNGELCATNITDLQIIGVALVPNPSQKYSVIFNGNDDPRFQLIEFLINALESPWHGWSYQREERREHHPAFENLMPEDQCACPSGDKYEDCCLGKEIVFPHFQFTFEVQPQYDFTALRILHKEGS